MVKLRGKIAIINATPLTVKSSLDEEAFID
jgi:hypothetical protein